MLEPVRQYARERLEATGEAGQVREQHAKYYLALAEEAEPKLRCSGQVGWLERLELEHANLRAALSWMLDPRDAEPEERVGMGLRLVAAGWQLWIAYVHLNEGCEWLERGLSVGGAPPAACAKALCVVGVGSGMVRGTGHAARRGHRVRPLRRKAGSRPHAG